MNKKQFLRLTLVLFLPLLALGWWIVENEHLGPTQRQVMCRVDESRYTCYTYQATKKQKNEDLYQRGNLSVNPMKGAVISSGLRDLKITTAGESALRSGILPAGSKLTIGELMRRSKEFVGGFCNMSRGRNGPANFTLTCDFQGTTWFNFDKPADGEMFEALSDEILEISLKNDSLYKRAFAVTIFLPFIAFLLVSLALAVLAKIVRFVIHGVKPKPQ